MERVTSEHFADLAEQISGLVTRPVERADSIRTEDISPVRNMSFVSSASSKVVNALCPECKEKVEALEESVSEFSLKKHEEVKSPFEELREAEKPAASFKYLPDS